MAKIARQKNAIYPQVAQASFSRFKALRRKNPVWNSINTTPIPDLRKLFQNEEVTLGPGWADAMVIDLENSGNDRKLFGELFGQQGDVRNDYKSRDAKATQVKKRRTRQIGPHNYGGYYPKWYHDSQEEEIIEADSWYGEETAPPPDGDRSLIPTTDFPAWCKTCEPTKTTTCRPTRPTRPTWPPRTTTCRPTRPTRPPRTTTCRPTRWTTRRTRPTRPPTTTTCKPTTTPTCPTCPTTTKGCRRCCHHHSCSSESSSSCSSSEERTTTTTRRPKKKRRKNKKGCQADWSIDWGFSFGSDSDWHVDGSRSRWNDRRYRESFSSSWRRNRHQRRGRGNRRHRRGRYSSASTTTPMTTTTTEPWRRHPRHHWKRRRTTTPDYSPDYSSDSTGFAWQPIKRLRGPRKTKANEPGKRILKPFFAFEKPNVKSLELEFQIPPPTTVETPFFYDFHTNDGDIVPSRSDSFDNNEQLEYGQQQYIENYDVDFWNVL